MRTMNTHLAGEPVEVKMLVEVQVERHRQAQRFLKLSLTSLPYYSTSYLGPKPLVIKDCQQGPPHLPLCSSSSKA